MRDFHTLRRRILLLSLSFIILVYNVYQVEGVPWQQLRRDRPRIPYVQRQIEGFPLSDIVEEKTYVRKEGSSCPAETIQFNAITPTLNTQGTINHADITHNDEPCIVPSDVDDFRRKINIVTAEAAIDGADDFIALQLDGREALGNFNQQLLDSKAKYYIGIDAEGRTCGSKDLLPPATFSFFVQTDRDVKLEGTDTTLTKDFQYMIIWTPDSDATNAPSCIYEAERSAVPSSPVPAPSPQGGSEGDGGGEGGGGGSQGSSTPTTTPASSETTNPSTTGTDSATGTSKKPNSEGGGSALSPGAIAGIAVGATFGAIAVGVAAFVSYRIYHGRTVPIIPDQLLPGPPSR